MKYNKFIYTFCSLITEIRIRISRYATTYIMKTVTGITIRTEIKPNVVVIQNKRESSREFTKNAETFFEKPFTASLKPEYILHLIVFH